LADVSNSTKTIDLRRFGVPTGLIDNFAYCDTVGLPSSAVGD